MFYFTIEKTVLSALHNMDFYAIAIGYQNSHIDYFLAFLPLPLFDLFLCDPDLACLFFLFRFTLSAQSFIFSMLDFLFNFRFPLPRSMPWLYHPEVHTCHFLRFPLFSPLNPCFTFSLFCCFSRFPCVG